MRKIFKFRAKRDPNAVDSAGYTPLSRAIINDDIKKLRELIAIPGIDLNLASPGTKPPLHAALVRRRYPLALELVKAGADLNLKETGSGQTPLHHAVRQYQELFVVALLKNNADPNIKDTAGKTALHYLHPSYAGMVEEFVKYKADVNAQDNDGNTVLHGCLDSPQMVSALVSGGADINICNNRGQSPCSMILDSSRLQKYPPELQQAILLRADLGSTNPLGETTLNLAARLESEETFLEVAGKAELSVKDVNGNNVLHALVRTQNVRMIEGILERAPKLINDINNNSLTPLHELMRRIDISVSLESDRWVDAARALLKFKADPDSADANGRGLLHYAVVTGKLDFLDEVMVKGANPNLADQDGKTALHYAIEQNNLRAMDVLLDRGANPDMTDARGWTILDRLAESGDRDSSRVQRLIVAGGQYQKQLPLHPEMMRAPRRIDKGPLHVEKTLDKPATKPAVKRSNPKL